MSRWAAAFRAIDGYGGRDTIDSVDTVATPDAAPSPHINRVNSVSPGISIDGGTLEAPDGALIPSHSVNRVNSVSPGISIDGGTLGEAAAPVPVADLVELMAEAMAANPVYRITNMETAMEYFRGVARNHLATASRGLP